MPDTYEKLQCLGEYGLSVAVDFQLLKFIKPGGFRDPAILIGHSEGLISLNLKLDYLPKSIGTYGIDAGEDKGGLQSRADYVWSFYVRHKQQGDKPFLVEVELPGVNVPVQVLVVFSGDRLEYVLFAARLFSGQLGLEQVRVDGWSDSPDLVQFENPYAL